MAYALQKALYDFLNPRGRAGAPALDAEALRTRYGLPEAQIRAVLEGDVAALYRLGVHPVLLNGFARARVPRDRYRAALASLEAAGADAGARAAATDPPWGPAAPREGPPHG